MHQCHLVALALLSVLAGSAIAVAAEPVLREKERAVICHVRLLEGDPRGSVEKGTIKVLSSPTLMTLEGLAATVEVGGTLSSASKGEVLFGTLLKVTPQKLKAGTCEATLSLEVTQPIKKEGDALVAVSGSIVRASGAFPLGVPTTITMKQQEDAALCWLEVTFENANEIAKPLPSAEQPTVPSAKAPGKSKRR